MDCQQPIVCFFWSAFSIQENKTILPYFTAVALDYIDLSLDYNYGPPRHALSVISGKPPLLSTKLLFPCHTRATFRPTSTTSTTTSFLNSQSLGDTFKASFWTHRETFENSSENWTIQIPISPSSAKRTDADITTTRREFSLSRRLYTISHFTNTQVPPILLRKLRSTLVAEKDTAFSPATCIEQSLTKFGTTKDTNSAIDQ